MPDLERDNSKDLTIWIGALGVAALGTWVMFDAFPGINWGIWTSLAAFGLLIFAKPQKSNVLVLLAAAASVIAFGAAVTANEFINFLSVLSVIMLLALEMLLAPAPSFRRITPVFAVPAPVVAFVTALAESVQRGLHALHLVRSHRARSVVRGVLLAAPVVIIFGLLLSTADPTFARWRDAIDELLSSWEFLPRMVFFFAMLAIVLGAYGHATKVAEPAAPVDSGAPKKWLGSTERLILLSSIAILFWVFLAVQVSYLFGNVAEVPGSGVTFADYARRGFAELTVVASVSVVLILVSERWGHSDSRAKAILAATLAVVVAVLLLLGSAFNRVMLYEEAYGFTTARLYAQVYMLIVGFALLALAWEMKGDIDPSRLFRRVAAVATLGFIVLIYWNHEAWIANKNIDRSAETGKLDVRYLARDLSPDAVPTLVARMPSLAEPMRSELRGAIESAWASRGRFFKDRQWYEWNLRRSAARRSLATLGIGIAADSASTTQRR